MTRTKNPAIRTRLIERAAHLLRTREPLTLRSLVADMNVSTMAVYTYFGGMDGVRKALRREGFDRLAATVAAVATSADAVRDLTALLAAYTRNAMDNRDLYWAMFDPAVDADDSTAADETLHCLTGAAQRAKDSGRFHTTADASRLATQSWAVTHGLVSLVANGPLPDRTLDNGVPLLIALYAGAGDDPDRCETSVTTGWDPLPADFGR